MFDQSLVPAVSLIVAISGQPSPRMTLEDCLDTHQATNASFRCVETKLLLEKDRDVSRSLTSSGIWEEQLVEKFLRILSMFPRYAFFNIGANLGIYTMYALKITTDTHTVPFDVHRSLRKIFFLSAGTI